MSSPFLVATFIVVVYQGAISENIQKCSIFPTEAESRIISGQAASEKQLPYQVSLRKMDSHFCGGAIIDNSTVLTAAHCFPWGKYSGTSVVAGTLKRDKPFSEEAQVRKVENVLCHEKYELKVTEKYDICLVKVDKPFVFDEYVQCIALRTSPFGYNDSTSKSSSSDCTLSGWGDLIEGSQFGTKELMYVRVPAMEQEACHKRISELTSVNEEDVSGIMCTFDPQGTRDACQGDSGGPVVCDGYLTGIVSFGQGCGRKDNPGAHTDVGYYYDWIQRDGAVSNNSSSMSWFSSLITFLFSKMYYFRKDIFFFNNNNSHYWLDG